MQRENRVNALRKKIMNVVERDKEKNEIIYIKRKNRNKGNKDIPTTSPMLLHSCVLWEEKYWLFSLQRRKPLAAVCMENKTLCHVLVREWALRLIPNPTLMLAKSSLWTESTSSGFAPSSIQTRHQQHQWPESEAGGRRRIQLHAFFLYGLVFPGVTFLQSIHAKDCSECLVDAWFDVVLVQSLIPILTK